MIRSKQCVLVAEYIHWICHFMAGQINISYDLVQPLLLYGRTNHQFWSCLAVYSSDLPPTDKQQVKWCMFLPDSYASSRQPWFCFWLKGWLFWNSDRAMRKRSILKLQYLFEMVAHETTLNKVIWCVMFPGFAGFYFNLSTVQKLKFKYFGKLQSQCEVFK